MRGGTHVVVKPRQGELLRARPASVLVGRLEDNDSPASLGKCDGRHKSVRSRSDDDRVDIRGVA